MTALGFFVPCEYGEGVPEQEQSGAEIISREMKSVDKRARDKEVREVDTRNPRECCFQIALDSF